MSSAALHSVGLHLSPTELGFSNVHLAFLGVNHEAVLPAHWKKIPNEVHKLAFTGSL